MAMVKSKGKEVVNKPHKLQTLEDNMREVDQKLSNSMAKMYDVQHQIKALLD